MRKLFLIDLVMAVLIIFIFSVDSGHTSTAAPAGSYFVSTAGSDRNPGTEKEPWKTIQKAAESVSPGSTVYIKAGTYYERINIEVSGASAEEPVIFRNYQNDQVIIDGSKSSGSEQEDLINITDQSFLKLIGLEITNNTGKKDDCLLTGIGIYGAGEGIEISSCRIHHIWYTGSSESAGAQAIAVYAHVS